MSHKGELIKMVKKETSIHDVDALILEKVILLKTAKTKDEKEKLRKQITRLEKHFNEVNEKQINGKKYPPKDMGYLSDKAMNKTEILKIINNTDTHENNEKNCYTEGCYSTEGTYVPDPSGVSVGQNRFIEIDHDVDIRTHER